MHSRRRTLVTAAAGLVKSAISARGGSEIPSAASAAVWPAPERTNRPWIVVAPHPDDETLGAGVLIAEHIAAGRDVHVLLLTRGTGSAARLQLNGQQKSRWWGGIHNPAAEGYAPLTADAFGQARYDELATALDCLGAARVHEAGLIDGQVTVAAARAAISALVAQVGQGAGVYTPSWLVDKHPDHLAAGQALRELAAEQPTVYGEHGWYILPPHWSDRRVRKVESYWVKPTDAEIGARARNACRAFAAWNPPHSYAIGYHSVDFMFAGIETEPRSLLHT